MDPSMQSTDTTFPPDVPRISPELALVDPELAQRIRHRIPRKLPGQRPPLPILRLPSVAAHEGDSAQAASG
jgi:hypothetical protein